MHRYRFQRHLILRLAVGLSILLFPLLVTVCGGRTDVAAIWDGSMRDSAGIQVVVNFGTALWQEGEAWEFTEVLRIGTVEGEPEYQFGQITGMAVLSDRRVVVADGMAHHLRFFSADGRYERTVGAEGQGPGEFGSGWLSVLQGPGDTILIRDVRNRQMHTFAPDGAWVGSFSALAGEGYASPFWDDYPSTGRIVSGHSPLRLPETPPVDTLDMILVRDVHGSVLDTLARIPSSETLSLQGDATLRHYYRGETDFDLCGDGLVTGRSDEYRLLWYGSDGAVNRIISLPWEPLPMTDEDQSVLLQRTDELLQQYNVPLEQMAAIKSTIRFEGHYPAYRRFVCGPSSTVLVQHVRALRDLDANEQKELDPRDMSPVGTLDWDVFDREGRYLGVVALPGTDAVGYYAPPRFVRDQATGTWYCYSVWRDEVDVEYVVAWRLDGQVPD
jgi:hypothetical protein